MINPEQKLHVAFSGGKDSVAVYGICRIAAKELGIDLFEMAHFQYNLTCVDPPELLYFVRENFPFVEFVQPEKKLWDCIVDFKTPPTRFNRYCCNYSKERQGKRGEYWLTGVRRAESVKRSKRTAFETGASHIQDKVFFDDNVAERRETEFCMQQRRYICNPIIDWTDDQVWDFHAEQNLPHCALYDEGYSRVGCIACPLAPNYQERDFKRWPGYKKQFLRTFDKLAKVIAEDPTDGWKKREWKTGEDVMKWWLGDTYALAIEDTDLFSLNT